MTKPRITLPNTEYDRGFENGALAARDAILIFLERVGGTTFAANVRDAWEADTLVAPVAPAPIVDLPFNGTKEVARQQGYTGDQCTNCNSLRMKIAGHCMVCEDCGTTTGCS